MEDCNALAADCVVVSCCCQCLILQILVFILLKLPCKLIRKTRDFAMKKLRERRTRGKTMINVVAREFMAKYKNDEPIRVHDQARGYGKSSEAIEEVDKVMEELSKKGEFGFGSFWCKEDDSREFFPIDSCLVNREFDGRFVRFEFIKMIGSLNDHG